MDQHDKKKIAVNYKAWTIKNHTNIAIYILVEIKLKGKNWVIKQKAADKLGNMIKSYKNMKKL